MKTILALDDSIEVLRLRFDIFTALGFKVRTFSDAGQALHYIMHSSVDLILTDYEMPEMSGVEFSRLCRTLGFPGPIVMVTGAMEVESGWLRWVNHLCRKGAPAPVLVSLVDRCISDIAPALMQTSAIGSAENNPNESYSSIVDRHSSVLPGIAGSTNMSNKRRRRGFVEHPSVELSVVA